MVTLRNQKCTKVKVSKTSPIEEKIIPLKKRPRGRPRKHPIVKSPVLKTLLIPQNGTGNNEENSLNRPMKKEYIVNDINISTVFEKTFPNATREAQIWMMKNFNGTVMSVTCNSEKPSDSNS